MSKKPGKEPVHPEEIEQLRAQLREAQETLRAIREGEVDAIVISAARGIGSFP